MRVIRDSEWAHFPSTENAASGLVALSEQAVLSEGTRDLKTPSPSLQADSCHPERIALNSRVLIIEGISGSGKDTFQLYLKKKLNDRDVHDYSEGELLQSWNQLQIKGIFRLRVRLMKLFVKYVRDIVSRDEKAVFLLNRFHLSAYAMTIVQQPKLEKEYDEIVNILRTLAVHVFILKLDESEIEKKSLHPERSSAWQKFQQEIVKKEGFPDRLQRYLWQQELMLEVAKRQQIPYSIIKAVPEIGDKWVNVEESRSIFRRAIQKRTPVDATISQRKRNVHRNL
jgi:thymidylate kinase